MTTREVLEIEREALGHYGASHQLLKLTEEAAELVQAVAKLELGCTEPDENYTRLINHVFEEAADMEIMLDQLKLMFLSGEALVEGWKTYKLRRLDARLKGREEGGGDD